MLSNKKSRPKQAAFFPCDILLLYPHKRILRSVADRTGPVIRQVFKLLSFFCIIINIAAYGTSPHNSLPRKTISKLQTTNPK